MTVNEQTRTTGMARKPSVPRGMIGLAGSLPDGRPVLPTLTDRQLEILKFIYSYALKNRDYPIGAEIGEGVGITKQAVASALDTLTKKGYVWRDRNFLERNIRLTEAASERMELEAGDLFKRS